MRCNMRKNNLIMPIVKWVGGKRQISQEITSRLPKDFNKNINTYIEPFFGGGAILFELQPKKAIINDINKDLITTYNIVKSKVEDLIVDLKGHINTAEYFYKIRDIDRDSESYQKTTDVKISSRLIYLNKTCYNGLFRVNSLGQFNTPFGSYKNPNIVNEAVLRAVSNYFNENDITFYNQDFSEIVGLAKKGDFVYFDPPYAPISDTANFTGYNEGGFDLDAQRRLKSVCDELHSRGVYFMVSNSSSDFIRNLWSDYNIITIKANRSVNSDPTKRGSVSEVIIRNYE